MKTYVKSDKPKKVPKKKITEEIKRIFNQKISEWGLLKLLDRRLASRATAKGHLHRIGQTARPSKGMSSHALKRKIARAKKNKVAK